MPVPDRCAALEVAISDVMILAPSIIVESALFGLSASCIIHDYH